MNLGSVLSWIFWIIIILIFVLGGWFWASKSASSWPFPNLQTSPLVPCVGTEQRLTLPLIYDVDNEVYRTLIHLGDATHSIEFNVIPDTGSNILIVSGPECGECPVNDGVWNTSLGQKTSNTTGIIRFGGGQVTYYQPWRGLLNDYTPGKQIDFGVITSSTSPDGQPLNVMGIQGDGPGLLDELCGQKTVVFDFPHSKLYIGNADDILASATFKSMFNLYKPPRGPAFILARIAGITINGQAVPSHLVPEYAVIDTGSTDTLVSPGLYNLLQNPSTVAITFEQSPSNNTSPTVTFQSTPDNIDSSYISVPNAMLIGNQWLKNYGIGFLYEQNQIVIFSS